jgi:hypothetical protein
MLEEFLNFEKNNITLFAKEVLSEYFDEQTFSELLNAYVDNRYYNYYTDNDISFEDNIMNHIEKTFFNVTDGMDEDTKKKAIENYLIFAFILYFDGVLYIEDSIFNSLLGKYRKKLFKIDDDLFQENISKFIYNTNKKREKFYKIFDTKDFSLCETITSSDNVVNVELKHNINFPKIYSDYAIDRVFDSSSISEDKMFVEYQLITRKILKDIKDCNFDKNYLLEFSDALFENKDGLKSLLETFNNDCFKNQAVFKIKYEDYCKYGNDVKDMIKEGYNLAMELDNEEEVEDLFIFNMFKYIMVDKDSKYCTNKVINDKIIIV